MARTSIADILTLIGSQITDDGASDARERLRAFLGQDKWSPDDLNAWINECLELASRARPEFYYALQDLIISIGGQLGFEVEYGSYTSTGAEIPYDGRWHALCGADLLIEVKTSPWPLRSASQLGQYMDEYALAAGLAPRSVFGLYAIGHGDFSSLVDQIRGSEYRSRIKVVAFTDLIRLLRLRDLLQGQMSVSRVYQVVQELLFPFDSIHIGGVLDIIEGVANSPLTPENGTEDEQARFRKDWGRTELFRFLDECQPTQVAFILALCSAPRCELTANEILAGMQAVAPLVPGLDCQQPLGPRCIGGARSGFSKREQQLGKTSIIESRNGRYWLRQQYREWVAEWLTEKGLLSQVVDLETDLAQHPLTQLRAKVAS